MSDERRDDDGPLGFGPADEPPREADPEPPRPAAQVPVPRTAGASRYGWFIGVVFVLVVALVTINSLRTDGVGADGVAAGTILPPFAVPLAMSDLDGDANIAVERGQGDAGALPACEVRGPEVLNICALAERGPVVLAFLATRGGDCADTLDLVERARVRHPGVQFAAVSIRGDRGDLGELIRERGWGFPVGYDRDGILANVYGVAVCPQITYARVGGRVLGTSFGALGARELDRRVERIVAASRRAGWEPPR